MNFYKFLLFGLLILSVECYSQDKDSLRTALDSKFQSFEYFDAVHIANILLKEGSLSKTEKLEVLRIKGVALYNLAEEDSSRNVFIELLKFDNDFSLDPVKNSPKIVEFFNNIKISQKEIIQNEMKNGNIPVEVKKSEPPKNTVSNTNPEGNISKNLIVRSLIFPGWGHFKGGESGKGWLLGSAGLVSLSSMVYFLIDCNKKENEYLTETDLTAIDGKYRRYNTSYKLRNISIAAYVVVWVYSQIDLLYLSNLKIETPAISDNPKISFRREISLSYQVHF